MTQLSCKGRIAAAVVTGGLLLAGNASAVTPNFFDDFENGVGGTPNQWQVIGSANNSGTTVSGSNNRLETSNSHNITPSGVNSARANASDPAAWNAYSDFGTSAGPVYATVWMFEDRSYSLLDDADKTQPVNGVLGLVGESGGEPSFTEFLYLGVIGQGNSRTHYGTRSLSGGQFTSAIPREAGWTKLTIEADAAGPGAQVRFYVDTPSLPNTLINTVARTNVPVRFVRLGINEKSYENFWYDDVTVVPEPGTAAMLGLGGLGALATRRQRRSL
jgi:hypothetical protein